MNLYETLALGGDQFKKDRVPIEHEGHLIWDTDKFLKTMTQEEWDKLVKEEEQRAEDF